MSGTSTSGNNGTVIVSGPNVIQTQDFYVKAGILHPVVIGSIAIIVLFGCLRLGSNRSIAPITTFDWLINVALGSTLAGIVNGNSLVRGLMALVMMLTFQYVTSTLGCRFKQRFAGILQSPPLVVCFKGKLLTKVMMKHRISPGDVNAALRQQGILNVCLVEAAIIEPNGTISVFTTKELEEAKVEPDVLLTIPAYRKLCELQESGKGPQDRRCLGALHGSSNSSNKTENDLEQGRSGGTKDSNSDKDMNDVAKKGS